METVSLPSAYRQLQRRDPPAVLTMLTPLTVTRWQSRTADETTRSGLG